jgi:hypothetical protein
MDMRHWRTSIAAIIAIGSLGLLGSPAFGVDIPNPNSGQQGSFPDPGTLNYVQGSAYVNGSQVGSKSVGNIELRAGQELTTGAGKAEILLTPGIFLRVGSNSEIKMISPDLERTQVELEHGEVGVEVDQIFSQNMIQIMDNGVTTQLMKTGYYEFASQPAQAKVFDGQAEVLIRDGKWEKVKGHHEMALLAGVHEKSSDFNSHPTNDALYDWSKLRSQYLAEANNQIAGEYAYASGFDPGWYWDPYMWDYTYLGGGPFFSPFGWGFYPWGGLYGGLGFYGGGLYGRGFYGGHFNHHGVYGRGPGGHAAYGGGFHGAGRGYAGGAIHGGGMGGGFHGGMSGGFHGGGGFGGGRR